jgi:serine/threonine kinase PknH
MRLAAYGEPVEGTPFGRYRLIELLGRGGMGEVWRAHDTDTDRIVAIKVLPAHFSDNEDFKQRFRREAHAAARLGTPHVVPIHDYGEIDGRLFVSMRLIEGRDLQTVLADGPLEPARAVRIIEQVAKALHAAHKVGLIHRDIKPSNVLLDDDDFAYLIDFGIAHAADETRMTKSGNTIGTFAYIAPERLDGSGEEDARVDIYSLACVLYEALTGEPPFAGDTMARLMYAHVNTPPPRPSITQPNVPAQFDAVIAKGMAKGPDQRYATTVELADAARDAITTPITRPTAAPPPEPPAVLGPAPPTRPAMAMGGRLLPAAPTAWGFGQPPQVPVRPPAALPPPGAPRAAGKRRRKAYIGAALAGVVIAAVTVVLITSRHHEGRQSSEAQISSGVSTSTSRSVAAVTAAQRDGLLLSADQINTAMAASGMTVDFSGTTLPDGSAKFSDKTCLAVILTGERAVYAGSGLTAVDIRDCDSLPTLRSWSYRRWFCFPPPPTRPRSSPPPQSNGNPAPTANTPPPRASHRPP